MVRENPTRAVIKTGKGLYTGEEYGAPSGDGSGFASETLALTEEASAPARERRLVFSETLSFLDEQTSKVVTDATNERLTHRETAQAFLNSAIASGPERPIQTPSGTVVSSFGQGGFGQLGFGGSVDVTG